MTEEIAKDEEFTENVKEKGVGWDSQGAERRMQDQVLTYQTVKVNLADKLYSVINFQLLLCQKIIFDIIIVFFHLLYLC